MSSVDKNQARCTQRALDIQESTGELLWQARCKQDSSATVLKEIISLLSLIMSSNVRERSYQSSVSTPFSSFWLQNHIRSLPFSGPLLSSHWDPGCSHPTSLSAFSVVSHGCKVHIMMPARASSGTLPPGGPGGGSCECSGRKAEATLDSRRRGCLMQGTGCKGTGRAGGGKGVATRRSALQAGATEGERLSLSPGHTHPGCWAGA